MNNPNKMIGTRVRLIRKDKGLTQKEFAAKLHYDHSHISKVESGETELSAPLRLAICNLFVVRKDWIVSGEGEMYDDRWRLLEERAKELGDDIWLDLCLLKATKEAHNNLIEKVFDSGGDTPQEKEYTEKLVEILRHKDDGTISAITQNIDTFLKVPDKAGVEKPQKKRKASNDG